MKDSIQSLTKKINTITKNTPIFYITNDPERALGIEKLINNYHIICIDDNELVTYIEKSGVPIFSIEKNEGKLNTMFRNSARALKRNDVQRYLKKHANGQKAYLMVFKVSPRIEREAEKLGFSLLNTSSELNRRFELKLSQYEELNQLDIHFPKTILTKLKDVTHKKISRDIARKYVIQFDRGHTGSGTIPISNKSDFDEVQTLFPNRTVRISKFIYGKAYTINACITKHGVVYGGLSYQLTGIEECTAQKSATVGNDWSYTKHLPTQTTKKIFDTTKVIGEHMAQSGFKGMFGLDIVVEKNTHNPYVIEINARQPASIPMHTKLQLKHNQIPLSLLAIAEFMNIDYEIDINEYNKKSEQPVDAAQIFLRNKYDTKATLIGDAKPGIYRIVGENAAYTWQKGKAKLKPHTIFIDEDRHKSLVFSKEAYAIDQIDNGGLLILSVKEGKIISPNAEVGRIQLHRSVLNKSGKIFFWITEMLRGLNKSFVLRPCSHD